LCRPLAPRGVDRLLNAQLALSVPLGHNIGGTDVEEARPSFVSKCASQHCLAGAWRAIEEHASRWPRTPRLECVRLADRQADRLQLGPGSVLSADVGEPGRLSAGLDVRRRVDHLTPLPPPPQPPAHPPRAPP